MLKEKYWHISKLFSYWTHLFHEISDTILKTLEAIRQFNMKFYLYVSEIVGITEAFFKYCSCMQYGCGLFLKSNLCIVEIVEYKN